MRPPDPGFRGPERATPGDIDEVNRLFTEAFTERYRRDGMSGVRVPFLGRDIWRYAMEDAGEGAMVWRDADGQLAAFNMVHQSGAEGWMGPLAVRTALQGIGLGSRVVRSGIDWLRRQGARIIGLETMPRTVENIGFYSRLGFAPGHLTVTLVRELDQGSDPRSPGRLLSRAVDGEALLAGCRALTASLLPGVDYTRQQRLTASMGLGDTTVLTGQDGGVLGFALWQTAPLALGRPSDEVRLLKIVARDRPAFAAVVAAVEHHAGQQPGLMRVSLRCQTGYPDAYAALIAAGYRVHWTDLRMNLPGPGPDPAPGGIVMSNWEI